jgi:hypothetical protein
MAATAPELAHMSGKLFGSLVGNPKREFRLLPAMRDATLRRELFERLVKLTDLSARTPAQRPVMTRNSLWNRRDAAQNFAMATRTFDLCGEAVHRRLLESRLERFIGVIYRPETGADEPLCACLSAETVRQLRLQNAIGE